MKKKYLAIGSFACMQLFTKAQTVKDSLQNKVNKTDIELVYNHYLQDGNNSAVTGGIGTEKLSVYGPELNIKSEFGKNALAFTVGSDIITSASTDKIDFVVSSASLVDSRSYINSNYFRQFEKQNLTLNGGAGLSVESDYLSVSGNLGIAKTDSKKLRTLSAQVQIYNDDLRWGRLNAGYRRPVRLVYPVELRTKEWYNEYKRNSYNVKLGFVQIINKRNTLGIFPELSYQQGLLATPFHRIYFSDGTEAVEQLPEKRYKGAIAVRLNTFVKGNMVLKNTVNGYVDNFGVAAFSLENETAFKIKSFLTVLANFRFYKQNASPYFAPYKIHQSSEKYYSSDYDLSSFQTYKIGTGLKYAPQKYLTKKIMFNAIIFRYSYYYRSNHLDAHIISLSLQAAIIK